MVPCYFALDCVPGDGELKVIDLHGGVGSGLDSLATAYGGQAAARARLQPYLRRLGELAEGRLILFVHDAFASRPAFPDAFFDLVQRHAAYGPITDWVPDLQEPEPRRRGGRRPAVEEMGVFLDPLAGRLRQRIGYCATVRVDYQEDRPQVLLSGYRERARRRGTTVILAPEEIGVTVFSGASDRFPDDFKEQAWFPVVNPPLLDRLLENRWQWLSLLEGTAAAARLPRWIPVGMGMRTSEEVREFARESGSPGGFPVAVLKPGHVTLSPGIRFLDRTALRALAVRQPEHRLPTGLAEELLEPRINHSYEEIAGYRGKLLDNLLRTPGARVHDHGDGTFHYSAPYPFLEYTVSVLQEHVDSLPIRSRRTGKLHRGTVRVVLFDRKIVAAIYRLDQEPDDGRFRDLTRPDVPTFCEAVPPDEEESLQAQLGPFVTELERQFAARIRSERALTAHRQQWILDQAAPG